jgi:hypothetical protein
MFFRHHFQDIIPLKQSVNLSDGIFFFLSDLHLRIECSEKIQIILMVYSLGSTEKGWVEIIYYTGNHSQVLFFSETASRKIDFLVISAIFLKLINKS